MSITGKCSVCGSVATEKAFRFVVRVSGGRGWTEHRVVRDEGERWTTFACFFGPDALRHAEEHAAKLQAEHDKEAADE